jgi:hypothetical protein
VPFQSDPYFLEGALNELSPSARGTYDDFVSDGRTRDQAFAAARSTEGQIERLSTPYSKELGQGLGATADGVPRRAAYLELAANTFDVYGFKKTLSDAVDALPDPPQSRVADRVLDSDPVRHFIGALKRNVDDIFAGTVSSLALVADNPEGFLYIDPQLAEQFGQDIRGGASTLRQSLSIGYSGEEERRGYEIAGEVNFYGNLAVGAFGLARAGFSLLNEARQLPVIGSEVVPKVAANGETLGVAAGAEGTASSTAYEPITIIDVAGNTRILEPTSNLGGFHGLGLTEGEAVDPLQTILRYFKNGLPAKGTNFNLEDHIYAQSIYGEGGSGLRGTTQIPGLAAKFALDNSSIGLLIEVRGVPSYDSQIILENFGKRQLTFADEVENSIHAKQPGSPIRSIQLVTGTPKRPKLGPIYENPYTHK